MLKPIPVIIANAQSLSAAIQLEGALVGIQMPPNWTAANLTFEASAEGSQFWSVEDSAGAEVSVTAVEDVYIALDGAARKFKHLKVRSGTLGVPVNQGAERVLVLLVETDNLPR